MIAGGEMVCYRDVYLASYIGVGSAALACSCVLLFFVPSLGLVNPYVKRIVRSFLGSPSAIRERDVFQISLRPRLYGGLRGFLEDADDVGALTLGPDSLAFEGDRITLSIPYSQIQTVERRRVGWRGLWVCGNRIEVQAKDGVAEGSFEFLERSSCTLPGSHGIAARVFRQLNDRVRSAQQSAGPEGGGAAG